MNRAIVVLFLLGMVVAALAAEASKDKIKMEKARMKKAKAMAMKERTQIEKLKDMKMKEKAERAEALRSRLVPGDKNSRADLKREYAELKKKMDSHDLTKEEFMAQSRALKERLRGNRHKQEEKDRNKREAKLKEAMRKKKSAYESKRASKARRTP